MVRKGPQYVTLYLYVRKTFPPFSPAGRKLNPNTQVKYWPTWMPFSFYQRHAAHTRALVEKLFSWPLELVQQQIVPSFSPEFLSPSGWRAHLIDLQAEGTANPSLAQGLLAAVQEGRKVAGETLDLEDVKHICGAVYGGTLLVLLCSPPGGLVITITPTPT
jgi:hypothetical protein